MTTTTNDIVYPRLVFHLTDLRSVRDLLNLPVLVYLMNAVMEIEEGKCCGGIRIGLHTFDKFKDVSGKYKNVGILDGCKA